MRIQSKGVKMVFSVLAVVLIWVSLFPSHVVFGAEDPQYGTSNDDIENFIGVGKTLIGKTPYVYGGGHSDWDEQKELDEPTGLDNSAFVAWVLYRGMGIDIGYAPISGNFVSYFEEVTVGSLEGVQRGDLIADARHVEIYLGQDESGKHYSLTATNQRNNVAITETNWGRGVTTKTILRPNISDAKEGVNGLSYDESAVIELWDGTREIGGSNEVELDATGGGSTPDLKDLDEDSDDEDKAEGKAVENTGSKASKEDLYQWLNPIVDFSGASNSHSGSVPEGRRIDSNNKGLKGHKPGFLDMFF